MTDGSKAAKPDFSLTALGGSGGCWPDQAERAEARSEDFRGYARAGKPDFLHQQQWKSRADRALRNARRAGYVR